MEFKAKILSEADIKRTLVRIAHQIIEKNHGTENLCFIGIKTRGVPIAKQLAENIRLIDGCDIPVGELDITHHRDDKELNEAVPSPALSNIPFDVKDKTVILIDDVIYTGRSARAALDAIMEIGRPQRIQLAVLVDRGHRELPIRADYVGKSIPTSRTETVIVRISPLDEETSVLIFNK